MRPRGAAKSIVAASCQRLTKYSNPRASDPVARRPLDEKAVTFYDTTRSVIAMTDVTLLVLASLAEGDKHGYAIIEDIERFSGHRLGPGTLYGAITRLEGRGWIKPIGSNDRRQPYTLTSSGREHLKTQVSALDRVLRAATRRLKHA